MRTLILDTSTNEAFLALSEKTKILFYKPLPGGEGLSLPSEIDALLKLHPAPLNAILAGHGPGSFTGTRVGLACAKTLAFAWNIPLFTFCSLAAYERTYPIAFNAHSSGLHLLLPNTSEPLTLSLPDAESLLRPYPTLLTPHPTELLARLPTLPWQKALPHPSYLGKKAPQNTFDNYFHIA